jgi:hypothetical protein
MEVMSEVAVDTELDAIADELYALRPDEFSAARDEKVREAKADGRQPLARELGKLRKPTQSAWLINLLWRDQREVMEQLFELASEMTRAQAEVSGPELRALTAQRRQLESAMLRQAEVLARAAGVEVSASTSREAQETLAAALAQPAVADEIRTGRLVKSASYAGFGTFGSGAPAPAAPRRETAAAPAAKTDKKAGEPKTNVIELRAAERARERREAAERRVDEARTTLDAAARTLDEQQREVETAQEQAQTLRGRLEELRQQVSELQSEVTAAERAAVAVRQQREQTEKAHAAAQRALEQAQADLDKLPSAGPTG